LCGGTRRLARPTIPRRRRSGAHIGTLVGAALGLLALLLAFSFSLALSRFEARSNWVLEEANAIGSAANFALMLPEPAQKPVATFVMSLTIAVVIMLVIDLDRPASGLIRVPVQALIDAQQAIPP
jgi:hypothetical protein